MSRIYSEEILANSQDVNRSTRRVAVVGQDFVGNSMDKLADHQISLGIWREVARSGADVTCVCGVEDPGVAEAISAMSSQRFTVLPLVSKRKSQPLRIPRGLDLVLTPLRPDVVHCVGEPWQARVITGIRVARRSGALTGTHFAENGPALGGFAGIVRRRRGRLGFADVDYAIGWSEAASRLARSVWDYEGIIRTLPAVGIPPSFYRDGPKARSGVIFAGRLAPEKGVPEVLAVARQLAPEGIPFRIVGTGPLRDEVLAAARHGLVEYLGPRRRTEVAAAMSEAAVTLAPSRPGVQRGTLGLPVRWEEQFGLVFAESLASSTPVVAYRCGAVPEVTGSGALLLEVGDIDGLAKATRRLLEDGRLWSLTAERGHRWARQFSDDSLAVQLTRLWDVVSR